MKRVILVALALCLSVSLQAQIKIGLIKPEEAMLKIGQFKELKMRFDQLQQARTRELDSLRSIGDSLLAQLEEARKNGQNETREIEQKLQLNIEHFRQKEQLAQQELAKREKELSQPFYALFNSIIEEIALEEGLNMVLNPNGIDESFRKYIGEKNFIDITDLVLERAEEY